MEQPPTEDRSDEMEGGLEQLGEHIDDAQDHLDEIRPDADIQNVTGDFEDTHTHVSGDDPVGAHEDAEHDDRRADDKVEGEQAGPT